jgi:hypothetical protein
MFPEAGIVVLSGNRVVALVGEGLSTGSSGVVELFEGVE